MSSAPKKYFVRFSQESDFDKIMEFYGDNVHDNVYMRKEDLVRGLVSDGSVVLAEDEKGNIVAAGITYAHKVPDANGVDHVQWLEFGTVRCILGGYSGLVYSMIALQAMRAYLVEPPENMFVMRTMTSAVQGMGQQMGFRRMPGEPPKELLKSMAKTISEDDTVPVGTTNWFMCGVEGIPTMAKQIKKVMDAPVLENKKTGDKIEVDFSKSSFHNFFKDDIKAIAGADFGDVEKTNEKQSMRQSQQKWMKKFFR